MSMNQLIFPINEGGTRQSVMQYFLDKYNYILKYGSWPCLQAGSDSRPVYLPMEVCKIVEGQRYSKKLNDRQVMSILRATCKRPQEREQSIRDMVMHNKYAEDRFAQEFGISSDLVNAPAHVLPPPLLKYHDSGREKTCAPSVGQWNMINKKMINGGTIDNWTCLNFSRMRPEDVHRFCMDLTHMCNATGMVVNPHPFIEVKSAAPNHIEDGLRDVHRRATQMIAQLGAQNQLQLLIVILPDVSGSYGKIKKVCETDIGIVSQCCLPRHASRQNKQCLENVALKINVKVGGRNTVLERAFVRNGIPYVTDVPTIIFGADVTHPPLGEDSASPIAAVVASIDWPEITKYRGLVSAQPHRQEIIEDLFTVSKDPQKGHDVNGGMIRELLIAFLRKTNRKPERIIFYRDGVSEGQFSHVVLHEMDAIRKDCASLEEGYLPLLTFVVVQKGHHSMLYDENHFNADALQSLANNLCHIYAGCSCAVSVDISATSFFKPVSSLKFMEFLRMRDIPLPLSDTDLVKKNKNCKVILVDIYILCLEGYDTLAMPENSSLEDTVYAAMRKRNINLHDWYIRCDGKMADPLSKLLKPCTLVVFHRLRGGTGESTSNLSIDLKTYIEHLRKKRKFCWFEKINIPASLQKTGSTTTYVIVLGCDARLVLLLLLESLERAHSNQKCFNGIFNIEDIRYHEHLGVIEIVAREHMITEKGYAADLKIVVDIINRFFRYKAADGRLRHPIYVFDLVTQINKLVAQINNPNPNKPAAIHLFKRNRSLIYNHPSVMSAAKRLKIFLLVILYKDTVKGANRTAFLKAINVHTHDWCSEVSGTDAASEMKSVFNYQFWDSTVQQKRTKAYHQTVLSKVDYCRCLITHAISLVVSSKQIDAAISDLWKSLLPMIQEKLIIEYIPLPIHSGGAGSFYRTDTEPEIIPVIDDLEIYEIFGLSTPFD